MAKQRKKPQSDTVIMTDKSGRARRQVKFWLDATKPQQAAMGEALDTIRKDPTQNFAAFMRNAVSLMLSLMTGDISVLLMLFPGIVAAIQQEARSELLAENAALKQRVIGLKAVNDESEDYIAEIEAELDRLQKQPSATGQPSPDAIQAQLDRIERQLIAQGNTPIASVHDDPPAANLPNAVGLKALQPVAAGNGGPKALTMKPVAAPAWDDEDDSELEGLLEVKKDESAGMRATLNFIKSLTSLAESPATGHNTGLSARQRGSIKD